MGYRYNIITGELDYYDSSSDVGIDITQIDTDSGSALPVAGIINLLGDNSIETAASGNTITIKNLADITRYVVDPTAGETAYQTIQSALDAANAAGIAAAVFIRPGIYAENLTLYDGIDLCGAVGIADTETCKIIGIHTPPASGTLTIRNIFLQSATHILSSAVAGTCELILIDCAVNVTNGYTFNLPNWTGSLSAFDIGEIGSTNDGWINNIGGSFVFMTNITAGKGSLNTCTISGDSEFYNAHIQCPITFQSTGTSNIGGGCLFDNTLTTSDTSLVTINNSTFNTGSNQAITHNSLNNLSISTVTIDSSNSPAVGGTGTIDITGVDFIDDTTFAGTLTLIGGKSISGSARLIDRTANAVAVYDTGGELSETTLLTDGELIIGSTGASPVVANLLSSGGTVAITNGPGSINLEAGAVVPTSFVTDSGIAIPALNVLNIIGGEGIDTLGAGNFITIAGEDATETNKGILELSTDTETKAGTDDATAVTPLKLVSYNNDKKFTGFLEWDGAGAYYSTLGTDLTILRAGSGYIKGQKISWTAPQSTGALVKGNTYLVYIDDTGTIGTTTSFTQAMYEDNIPLFEILCDNDTPSNTQVVKENHPYSAPTDLSIYLHNSVGTVISNRNNGANITLIGVDGIEISGTDYLEDHGLETTLLDSGGVPETWDFYYTDATGKWVLNSSSAVFPSVYNNAGVVTALGISKYGIFRLYCSKEDLNSTTPHYIAVIDDAQYNNLAAADVAISNGSVALATNELFDLEVCQLGYVIYEESSSSIVDVMIEKATLRGSFVSTSSSTANLITTDTTNFNGWLSASDTTVQTALETLDDVGLGVTPQHAVLLADASFGITSEGPGSTGELLVSTTGGAPSWSSTSYGDFSFNNVTSPATPRQLSIVNTDVNAASTADLRLSIPPLGGDCMVSFEIQASSFYSFGIDNSDSDTLKITTSSDPSSGTEAFAVDNTTAAITFANAYEFPIADGTASYPLVTDGAGNLDFSSLSVAGGGTGLTTITDHALVVGSGTSALTEIGPLTDGQIVVGSTGLDPVATTLTAGTGISITNGAGSITVNATGGGVTWTNISANQALVPNNGVNCTGGAALSLSLPATSSVGDVIEIALDGSTSWTITQAANQQIRIGNQTTTLGAGGSLASTAQGDWIRLVCKTSNLIWTCVGVIGNITVT